MPGFRTYLPPLLLAASAILCGPGLTQELAAGPVIRRPNRTKPVPVRRKAKVPNPRKLQTSQLAALSRTKRRIKTDPRLLRRKLFVNEKVAFASLGRTGKLHLVAYHALAKAEPLLELAQQIERLVLSRVGQIEANQYQEAFAEEIAALLRPFEITLVKLADIPDPSEVTTLQERFNRLETWVDILHHGEGHHGKLTHAIQVVFVLQKLREAGYENQEIHQWYRSMGNGKAGEPVAKFSESVFDAQATTFAKTNFSQSDMRAPWPVIFEAFQGETAPVNLSTLLSTSMLHPYWRGL